MTVWSGRLEGIKPRAVEQIAPVPVRPGLKVVLCIGVFSSGSTWAFNAAGSLCNLRSSSEPVMQIYADDITDDQELNARETGQLVIKTHIPSAALRVMASVAEIPVILTVREPLDAVASLITRFAFTFEQALLSVERSCRILAELSIRSNTLLLRYEDGFHEMPETVGAIAKHLGVDASEQNCRKVFDTLTPSAVAATIEVLGASGIFGDLPPSVAVDSYTQWHPGHIGDRRVGKWPEILSPSQAARVTYATRSFCSTFSYECSKYYNLGTELAFGLEGTGGNCLEYGFSLLEPWGVWVNSPTASLRIKFQSPFARGVQVVFRFLIGPTMTTDLPDKTFRVFVDNVPVLELLASSLNPAFFMFAAYLGEEIVAGSDTLDVRFESDGMLSPAELGISGDHRQISLGLIGIRVSEKTRRV